MLEEQIAYSNLAKKSEGTSNDWTLNLMDENSNDNAIFLILIIKWIYRIITVISFKS